MSNFIEYEFNYASIKLEPYRERKGVSPERLLRDIMDVMSNQDFPAELRVIDRHANRNKNTSPRKIVHISSRLTDKGSRYYCQMALIKNKAPMMWGGNDLVEEIQKDRNKKFIEMTNYVVHFAETGPILMVEFNSAGPRLSDIEYYLRQVSKRYKIARAINSIIHLNLEYSELEDKITNIFDVQVKLDSGKHLHTNSAEWYKPFQKLKEETGYREVKMEFFYGRKKDPNGSYRKNIRGLNFGRSIINWLKQNTSNIEHIEDLKMSYELNDNGDVVDLDFLKNKTTSFVQVPSNDDSSIKKIDLINTIGTEFNYYLSTGKTHDQSKVN